MKILGIDNGTSGSIGWYAGSEDYGYFRMPVKEEVHYASSKGTHKRIDWFSLIQRLKLHEFDRAYIERPFTTSDPKKRSTMLLAMMAYESTKITLEVLKIPFFTIDSKEWQRGNLGGVKTTALLKKVSRLQGIKLFPNCESTIKKQKDADGIFIAYHYYQKENFNNRIQEI